MSYRGHFIGHMCLTMFTPVVLILEMVHVSVQHVYIYALVYYSMLMNSFTGGDALGLNFS